MKLRIKSLNLWTAFKVGVVFHFILHGVLFAGLFLAFYVPGVNVFAQLAGKGMVTIAEITRGSEWVRAGVLMVGGGALVGGVIWAILALIFTVAAGLTGGIELYMSKAPAPRPEFYEYSTSAPALAQSNPITPESATNIDERRALNDRLYRIQQYNRLQQRRRQIRDE
ncbi:MAG TPA: hypothetical protein PLD47_13870 [Aggregatilineales bacterium]|nr:MAG: hypothetical protein HKUEN02_01150 [Anaerolineaceae bacterium]HRE48809.1 hypothetical protein [Aggregatilineales bacterium]